MSDAPPPFGTPRCIGCSYVLDGLEAGPCPECGRAFDPKDPSSISYGQRIPVSTRGLLAPPGWLLTSAAAIVSIWFLVVFSMPAGADFGFTGLALLVGGGVGLVYVAR